MVAHLLENKKDIFDKTTKKKKKAKKYLKVNKWKNSDRESSSSNGEKETSLLVIKERNSHLDLWLL